MVDCSPTVSNDGLESDHGSPSGAEQIEPTVLFPARKTKFENATNRKKYTEMIVTALYHLSERGGSSRQAVIKYIKGNFEVTEKNVNRCFALALAKLEKEEQVIRKSGIGANGRFILSKTTKDFIATGKKPTKPKKPKKNASKTKANAAGKKTGEELEGDESSDKENIEKPSKNTSKTKSKAGGKVEQAAKTKKANGGTSSGNADTKKAKAKAKKADSKAPETKKAARGRPKAAVKDAVKDDGEEETAGAKKTTGKASKKVKDVSADKDEKAAAGKTKTASKETGKVGKKKESKTTKEKKQKVKSIS